MNGGLSFFPRHSFHLMSYSSSRSEVEEAFCFQTRCALKKKKKKSSRHLQVGELQLALWWKESVGMRVCFCARVCVCPRGKTEAAFCSGFVSCATCSPSGSSCSQPGRCFKDSSVREHRALILGIKTFPQASNRQSNFDGSTFRI